jgi:3-hydroxymyristoyl/3-hydroxydecanoyl-(acyl carrier protein) dehydratase
MLSGRRLLSGKISSILLGKYHFMPTPHDHWLPLTPLRISSGGRWESSARFEAASGWFSGHFEGFPILPGVALLALISEIVRKQAEKTRRVLVVSGFSRVRFKLVVLPDQDLFISLAAMPSCPEAKLDFQVFCGSKSVVQGYLVVKESGN